MSKTRLDVAMAAQGLAESRQKAQAIIMSGLVFVDGKRVDKCGAQIADTAVIEVRGKTLRYVSRGGLKLEKAMQCFPLTLQDAVAMDCGASTGGFTDCMLQNGAKKVYAVDVGYGQLDWKLRNDPRVVCLERTNARYLDHEQVPDVLDFVSVDVSFISLGLIFPALRPLLADNANLVCLIKPQFEAGKDKVGILAKLSTALANLGVAIDDINQEVNADNFQIVIHAHVATDNSSWADIQQCMENLGKAEGIDVKAFHADAETHDA